jgi:hypothetical protein
VLSIEIFQNGPNEELVKFYHVSRGHSQGEIEPIHLMLTTYGIYILVRKETGSGGASSGGPDHLPSRRHSHIPKFVKEAFISHSQIDYIEVSIGQQAFQLVCINKRQNCWITTASRLLTQ